MVDPPSLSAGVTYTFQIIAVNAAGTSLLGTATGTPFTAPGAPGVGTGVGSGASVGTSPKTAVITFIQGATNGNSIKSYNYSTAGTSGPWTGVTTVGTFTSPGTNLVTISPLAVGTYTFNLQAANDAGTGLPGTNTYGPVTMPYNIKLLGTVNDVNSGLTICVNRSVTSELTISHQPISTSQKQTVITNTGMSITTVNSYYVYTYTTSAYTTSYITSTRKLLQVALGKSNQNTVYYVAYDTSAAYIYKGTISGTSIPVGTFGASLSVSSKSIALNSSDVLYMSDNNGIYTFDSSGAKTPYIAGSKYSGLIAIDNSNNVYCYSPSNKNISKITPTGLVTTMTFIAGSHVFTTVTGFIHGSLGTDNSLFVTDYASTSANIWEIPL